MQYHVKCASIDSVTWIFNFVNPNLVHYQFYIISPIAPILRNVPFRMVGRNKLCNPGRRILLKHLDFFAPAGVTLRFTQPKHIALLVLVKVFFLWKVIVSNLWLGVGTGNDELSNNKLFSLFLDSVSINTEMKTICIACTFTNANMMFTLVYTGWFF